jgi:hypothetical protein
MLGVTALIVCPSPANAANLLVEFKSRIPNTIARLGLNFLCPSVCICDFSLFVDCTCQLTICTADQLTAFVQTKTMLPPVDYIILDEYHLGTQGVINARFLLRHCTPLCPGFENQKVVLVSATPPDEPPPPIRLSGLTIVKLDVPDPLTLPTPPIYILGCHKPFSNNCLLTVVDSCEAAHTLSERLINLNERCFCLCACPTPEVVARALDSFTYDCTFIATPDTEAGITVPCSIMVNPGLARRIDFKEGVIVPHVASLGERQSNQRLGRAGRLGHTIVYTQNAGPPQSDSASIVSLGNAYILVLALSAGHPRSLEANLASERFKRLLQLTPRGATKCLTSASPMVALYKVDNDGHHYREFGGSSTTFVVDNAMDFRLFKWPGGSAYAPYLDLCGEHDLSKSSPLSLQKSIADSITARDPSVLMGITIESAVLKAESSPRIFSQAIWQALKTLDGPSNLSGPEVIPPTHERCQIPYMLSPIGARCWLILRALGGRFTTRHGGSTNGLVTTLREFSFSGERFSYDSSSILDPKGMVDPLRVAALLLPALSPVVATSALADNPKYSIDLTHFRSFAPRSSNSWFKRIVK